MPSATPPVTLTPQDLRRYAIARSLFAPTTLARAIARLGFVQADPLRAPARAQDLILRHRVAHYRAGDLERRYPQLDIEEDFFINYGFMPSALQRLMHPRTPRQTWPKQRQQMAHEVLAFVQATGITSPAQVDAQFNHGRVRNWFGGHSRASTQLLDEMHYHGLLRVAQRHNGQRLYAARTQPTASLAPQAILDELLDAVIYLYAPLPRTSLTQLAGLLSGGVPQWPQERKAALQRALARHPSAELMGATWLWPAGENPASLRYKIPDQVRLLAPFDPVVWDRRRFELFWGWAYRFEAYVPAAQRVRGHYALPLLWRDEVIGWANLRVENERLTSDIGYARSEPTEAVFHAALGAELQRMALFLGLSSTGAQRCAV